MKVIRRLGNNAAVGLDKNEKEVVIFGKGVGFPKVPYDLEDLSVIERTFYNVDSKYFDLISNIREDIMLASADIVEQAGFNLDCELNPNLVFTLADHLQFAIERHEKGMQIGTPLAYDVIHLYPDEYELGLLGLDVIEDTASFKLPKEEAITIALHIINAEIEKGNDMHDTLAMLKVISQINDIIEKELSFQIDKESYSYSRFTMHIRYLIQRFKAGTPIDEPEGNMFRALAKEYPDVYQCCFVIKEFLKEEYGWTCTREETTFLMIHVVRLKNKSI